MQWHGKRVLVVGLGVLGGGVSTVKWLAKKGCRLTVTDLKSRSELKASLQNLKSYPIKFVLGKHPLSLLNNIDLVVQNPAVPNDSSIIKQAVRHKIPIANEASIFFEFCPAPIIAVTGSKGKSTVATLVGKIFAADGRSTVVAGNIKDRLMLNVLPKIKPTTTVVLELSSWQLEGLARFKVSPQIAVITNILPDHMDRYKNLNTYAKAKANIFVWQNKSDRVILNFDNPLVKKLATVARGQIFWFSLKNKLDSGCYVYKGAVWFNTKKKKIKLFNLKDVELPGQHNIANVLAAAAVAAVAGVKSVVIKRAIKNFNGLHSRLELIRVHNGVSYINDTTATMPYATQCALASLKSRNITLIGGGHDKKLDYTSLANAVRKTVANLILFPGSATNKIIAALPKKYKYSLAPTMKAAVKQAQAMTPPNGVVLMSPGAASFGTFVNEWDRGSQFVKEVKAIR